MTTQLATASVTSRLSGLPGRAIVTARGHHFVVDSPPPLGGPNEEINPIDVLLSALATCGTFVCETAAQEMNIPLHTIALTAAGDFDPRGICGEPVDSKMQAFRVRLILTGPTKAQAEALAEAFRKRCPVYTTLSLAAPIDFEIAVENHHRIITERRKVMKLIRCRDAGFDCNHEVRAESEEDLLQQVAQHA
ncbi:MAG: OsmC family protein, partial [Thermodesulfobacteriota bacterium]